jgi:hypothetical protein
VRVLTHGSRTVTISEKPIISHGYLTFKFLSQRDSVRLNPQSEAKSADLSAKTISIVLGVYGVELPRVVIIPPIMTIAPPRSVLCGSSSPSFM